MLYTEPHAGTEPIIQVIREARKQVAIDTNELDDAAITRAIRDATHRGVAVQVILAPRPWGHRSSWAQGEFRRLAAAGAEIRWSPFRFSHHYAYDHAHIVVDDQGDGPAVIDSGNITWHAIYHAREDLWITRNHDITHALAKVFDADWLRLHAGVNPRRSLIISPGKTDWLSRLLDQPGPVDVEARNFGYLPRILRALERKKGDALLILPATLSHYDHGNLRPVIRAGVQVRYLKGKKWQGLIVSGRSAGFIGSQNLSWSVLHTSRNVGVIIRGQSNLRLRAAFQHDWRRAQPTP